MNTSRILAWLAAPLLVSRAIPAALAVEIQLSTVAETSLMERFQTNNIGAEGYVTCGSIQDSDIRCFSYCRNRALIKYDVAGAIPPGSRIRYVRFVVWMSYASLDDEAHSLDLSMHRMLVPWEQGTGLNQPMDFPGTLGRPVEPGEACWNYRQAPDVLWGFPGGAPGVDFVATASGGIQGIGNVHNEIYSTESTNGPVVEDIQFWLDNPSQNHGWLLKATDEAIAWTAKRLRTPEASGPYPYLVIDYVPPPSIEDLSLTNSQVSFTFVAEPAQPYLVEYSLLSSGTWSNLLAVPPPVETTNILVLDAFPPGTPARFYRVTAP